MNSNEINIIIKDAEQRNDEQSAFVQFSYHPQKVKLIKQCSDRRWNMETKYWEIPVSQVESFKEKIQQEFPNDLIYQREEIYDATIPDSFVFKVPPLPHQKEAIEYGLNHPSFLNGDQQGLGKTYESLMVSEIRRQQEGLKHTLILCGVNSLKQNWKKEVEQFTNQQACIIGQRITRNDTIRQASTEDKLEDLKNIDELPYYLILNIESLQSKEISDRLSDLCVHEINMVIFDELHKCKSYHSKTGEHLLRLNPKYKLGLSGTPMLKDPLDLYLFLRWIGVEQRNYWQFCNHFQIRKEIILKRRDEHGQPIKRKIPIGFKNLEEIHRKIKHFMIRRLKEEVLDLPEKIYTTELLEMGPKQKEIYEEIYQGVMTNLDKIKAADNPLTELMRLRQATADPSLVSSHVKESVKLDRAEDIVKETIENNEKILVFTYHHEFALRAKGRLKKYKPAMIVQETKDPEKEKRRFQTKTDVLIGTIGVMGTGHTLVEATNVLFLEEPWSNGEKEQAEDRAHRIGQTQSVNYITLLCEDTVDQRVHEIISKKKDLADMVVDKKRSIDVEYLLKR